LPPALLLPLPLLLLPLLLLLLLLPLPELPTLTPTPAALTATPVPDAAELPEAAVEAEDVAFCTVPELVAAAPFTVALAFCPDAPEAE
jgi:hypothetical protein